MEIILYSIVSFIYIILGFGVRDLLYRACHKDAGFPLVPILWPLILVATAFSER